MQYAVDSDRPNSAKARLLGQKCKTKKKPLDWDWIIADNFDESKFEFMGLKK
jgi:hypothetical protein